MLRIPQIEEIQSALLEVPTLINSYQAKDPQFLDNVLAWFKSFESMLQMNRLTVVSEIAGMRGALISARRGMFTTQPSLLRRTERRRAAEMVAEQMLRTSVDVVTKRIDRDLIRINKAEDATIELVNVGRQLKIIPINSNAKSSPAILHSLWDSLANQDLTRNYTILIRSNVGPGDALILLDRVLQTWSGMPK